MTVNELTDQDARKVASRLAARCEIRDLRAVSVSAELVLPPAAGRPLHYTLEPAVTLQWDGESDEQFVVQADFDLRVSMVGDTDDASREDEDSAAEEHVEVAHIQFALQGLYSLSMRDGDEPATTRELEALAKTTGLFALYPFAREWAHDLTSRLGLPPLTLGVLLLAEKDPNGSDKP